MIHVFVSLSAPVMTVCTVTVINVMVHLFDGTDRGDVVHLSAPLVVAVVLSPLGHVPQVLTAPEVLLLVTDPSLKEGRGRGESQRQKHTAASFIYLQACRPKIKMSC